MPDPNRRFGNNPGSSGLGGKGGGTTVPNTNYQFPNANQTGNNVAGANTTFDLPAFGGPYTQSGNTPSFNLMAGANNAMLQGGPSAGALDQIAGPGFGALEGMLSGQPNYGLVQDAVRAGAQPTLDIFREDIMPELRSRSVATNNPTGEIKDFNRIVPRMMRDITNAGTQASLGEYNRAMGSRDQAAGLMSGLAGSLLGNQSEDMRAGLAMMPQTIQTGMMPMQMMAQYGDLNRGFHEQALQDSINRWNFNQNRPMEMTNWYNQVLSGVPGLGGTQTSEMASNPALGAAGGLAAGGGLAALLNSGSGAALMSQPYLWPLLIGGGLLGALG